MSSEVFCDSATQRASEAEWKLFSHVIFRAISELDHNASMALSLGFSLPFALLALQSP